MKRTCLLVLALACAALFSVERASAQCIPYPAPTSCFGEPPPVCVGPPSSSAGFVLTCGGSPAIGCTTPPILMIGTCAPPPGIPIPPPIGCTPMCALAIGVSFGTFPDPLFVPPGLPVGATLCAQCGCLAVDPTGRPCVNLADTMTITIVP